MILHVRARGDVMEVQQAVRAAVRSLDPQLPVLMLDTMEGQMATSMSAERMVGALVGLFALLSIALAAVGVYGVTSVLVAQRIPEIGLRIALGAGEIDVVRLVVGRAVLVAGVGVVAGLLLAFVATQGVESLLFGVGRLDPITFGAAALSLLAAALIAGYLPARRASRIDPMIAMKS